MLLSKVVKIKVTPNMCKYYKEKGYQFKCNDTIEVKVEDLPKGSNQRVAVKCDCCGKVYDLQYYDFVNKKGKTICRNCTSEIKKKREATCIEKYGVPNPFQSKEVQDKQHRTLREKYDCDNVFQLEEVKKKSAKTMEEKYGANHPMKVDEIKNRVLNKALVTKSKNGTQICSAQQRYIGELYNAKINYLYEQLWLDIYFQEENIYCEYDGSGHNINVTYQKVTQEEFDEHEIKRYKFLKSRGFKEFRIISRKDLLPSDDVLIEMKNVAFDILLNNKSNFVEFNIDNSTIRYKNFEAPYDYQTLRKISNAHCNDC